MQQNRKHHHIQGYDPANGMTCMQSEEAIVVQIGMASYDPANGMTCMQFVSVTLTSPFSTPLRSRERDDMHAIAGLVKPRGQWFERVRFQRCSRKSQILPISAVDTVSKWMQNGRETLMR